MLYVIGFFLTVGLIRYLLGFAGGDESFDDIRDRAAKREMNYYFARKNAQWTFFRKD
jgi:hypothetical protein